MLHLSLKYDDAGAYPSDAIYSPYSEGKLQALRTLAFRVAKDVYVCVLFIKVFMDYTFKYMYGLFNRNVLLR